MYARDGLASENGVIDAERVSLRGMGKRRTEAADAQEVSFFFRGPKTLKDYVVLEAHGRETEQGKVILAAIALERDLGDRLASLSDRIEAFAAERNLSLEQDLPEILARLVRRGLGVPEQDEVARAAEPVAAVDERKPRKK
jgi:hypothetical protein